MTNLLLFCVIKYSELFKSKASKNSNECKSCCTLRLNVRNLQLPQTNTQMKALDGLLIIKPLDKFPNNFFKQ